MTVTMSSIDVDRLDRRFEGLKMRTAALQGQSRELSARQAKLARSVSLAKARLEMAPQATSALEYLQEKAHAKAVGEFEELLTDFVEDVVPNEGKIRLELSTERGAPALDILLDNGGDLEDIYHGNGGGMTNVVVTALGFSALYRTRNRQLMLLDEPDCWLKSTNVPAFTRVIAEVSNPREVAGVLQPGCQTLMVSHNDVSLMDDGAHIQNVRVDYDLKAFADRMGAPLRYVGDPTECAYVVWVPAAAGKGHIEVRYRPAHEGDEEQNALTKGYAFIENLSGARSWEESMPGLRWIELENMRRHIKTRLNLSAGLNVVTGGVNSGKSTLLFTALRAMAYGESDDSQIRHGAEAAVVRLGLENGVMLEMVRNRKGSPKVVYRRYVDGIQTNEAAQENRNSVPGFIREALRIERVDGMDVQLRHQKEPVFLLNEPASRRARLLSIGKESGTLQSVIEKHRLSMRRDKELIKREEVELNEVNRTLTVLAPLASLTGLAEILGGMLTDAMATAVKLNGMRSVVSRLGSLQGRARLSIVYGGELDQSILVPRLADTAPMLRTITLLAANEGKARLPDLTFPPSAPKVATTAPLEKAIAILASTAGKAHLPMPGDVPRTPTLQDTRELSMVIGHLCNGQKSKIAVLLGEIPAAPQLCNTTPLRQIGMTLAKGQETITKLQGDEALLQAEHASADSELKLLKSELGVCPLCHHAFDGHQHG